MSYQRRAELSARHRPAKAQCVGRPRAGKSAGRPEHEEGREGAGDAGRGSHVFPARE